MYTLPRLALVTAALLLASCSDSDIADEECGVDYTLPADVDGPLSAATQSTFDEYSWQTFLSLNAPEVGGQVSLDGDNATQVSRWSSTVDLIECNLDPESCLCPGGDCSQPGSRQYPVECQNIPGFERYRVLGQIDKADDSFLEAETQGLSNKPILDAQGNFVRYEILLAPATYRHLAENRLYDWEVIVGQSTDLLLPCGDERYTGGDPADADMGSLVVKLAWMEEGLADARYHQEQLLVYQPSYRTSDGVATCDLRTMALVGMHVGHKTVKQPTWLWSTFEHVRNAPPCFGLPPSGRQMAVVNTGCPADRSQTYNFAPQSCADGQCATCNASPQSNDPDGRCLVPGSMETADGWCLDLMPNPTQGLSQLCTQVSVADYYPDAHRWNEMCQATLGERSVWSQYKLISTQNFAFETQPTVCANVVASTSTTEGRTLQRPQVPISADPNDAGDIVPTRPWLGNTSMESYERSNCTACHAQSTLKNDAGDDINTDYMYFLAIETCAAWCDANDVAPCTCLNS